MGVMQCDREGCRNIMCDTIIENQYICSDCKQEFMDLIGEDKIPYEEMVERFKVFLSKERLEDARHRIVNVKEFLGMFGVKDSNTSSRSRVDEWHC